ncbi:MAG: hypothetical protein K2M39_02385 [Muribaculaceae bacterium]|nr:hypothetical protein [Muribaculaceae bacterium]
MKKLYFIINFILILFVALPVLGKSMFVYRNDGVIDILETGKIDSIRYSRFDINMIPNEKVVVQEIFTKDSLYRIPLNVMDSIGFHIPKTVYKPDVIVISDGLRPYIQNIDELSIYLHPSTPAYLLPKPGDKLVMMTPDEDITRPFLGKVVSINHGFEEVEVICDPVALTDIYEIYYYVQSSDDEPLQTHKKDVEISNNGYASLNQYQSFNLLNSEDPDWAIGFEPNDNFSINTPTLGATLNVAGETSYNTSLIIHPAYGVNLSIDMTGTYTTEEILSISGSLTLKGEKTMLRKIVAVPRALVEFYFEIGGFADFTGEINADVNLSQKYLHKLMYNWSSNQKNIKDIHHSLEPLESNRDGELTVNGNLQMGIIVKTGVAFICTSSLDISEIGLEAKGGIDISGNTVISISDAKDANKTTELYRKLKNSTLDISFFYGSSFAAKLFKWSYNKELPNLFNIPLNKDWKVGTYRLVPNFSNSLLLPYKWGWYEFKVDVEGNVFDTLLGIAVINTNNCNDATYDYLTEYQYQGPEYSFHKVFSKNNSNAKYNVYPLIKCLGIEMIAEPYENTEKLSPRCYVQCKNQTHDSAELNASFYNVPDDGACFIYLQWEENGETKMITKETTSGENKTVRVSGLIPSTTYVCTAAVVCGDREYLSDECIFTTFPAPNIGIDLSGTWMFYAEGFYNEPLEVDLIRSERNNNNNFCDNYEGSCMFNINEVGYVGFLDFSLTASEDGTADLFIATDGSDDFYYFLGTFDSSFTSASGKDYHCTYHGVTNGSWKFYRKTD